jgi:hypothetical protein
MRRSESDGNHADQIMDGLFARAEPFQEVSHG